MNKTNRKILDLSALDEVNLPIIGEDIRSGDTLIVGDIKSLKKTVRQLVEYLLTLDSEGINFQSIQEPYLSSNTKEGKLLVEGLRSIQEASKNTLSLNSSRIVGSGRKKDSFCRNTELAVVAMYKVNPNVSAIAIALNIGSRDTVYRHLKRNNLK